MMHNHSFLSTNIYLFKVRDMLLLSKYNSGIKALFSYQLISKFPYYTALLINITKTFLNYKNLNKDNYFQLYDTFKIGEVVCVLFG